MALMRTQSLVTGSRFPPTTFCYVRFRKLFPYSKWGAQLNARITPAFFTWLVGPMQTEEVDIEGQGSMRSAVHIEKCRYGLTSAAQQYRHCGQALQCYGSSG